MKKKSRGLILFFVLFYPFYANCQSDRYEKKHHQADFEVRYYTTEIPKTAYFCDEKIDLTNYYLRERYDRELLSFSYWHSQLFLMIKRANKFFPIIEPILKSEGIHNDFKYLALIESSLDQRAYSPAKAAGMWQILATTAKEYGLEVTEDVDERYNLEKATAMACQYLKKTYEQTGTWSTAAASYNAGRAGVLSKIKVQQTDNYFDMLFSEETNRYVFRMIIAKQILANPQEYGFFLKKEDLYYTIDCDEIEIDSTITNLTDFAKSYGTSYQILKDLNPWLRTNKLDNKSQKTYCIKVPKKNAVKFDPKKIQVYQDNWVVNP
jgi:hypothetical protein